MMGKAAIDQADGTAGDKLQKFTMMCLNSRPI